MGKAPADQFYWNDWLSDVQLQQASACSKGVWMNALCRMWYNNPRGELNGTKESLAKLCICSIKEFDVFLKDAQALLFCYVSRSDNGNITLRNRRMVRNNKERELNRLRQERYRDKQKNNAKITPPSSSSSSSSTSKKKDTLVHFALFYNAYPRKRKKGDAEKAFKSLNPNQELLLLLLEGIERAKKSDDWQKDDGKYIPFPATWLRAKGWEDEFENKHSVFDKWEPKDDR